MRPEIKTVKVTLAALPFELHLDLSRRGGIRTRNPLLQREVTLACAPGTSEVVAPEIKCSDDVSQCL